MIMWGLCQDWLCQESMVNKCSWMQYRERLVLHPHPSLCLKIQDFMMSFCCQCFHLLHECQQAPCPANHTEPQPRCYQTTSCLWLFSSSMTTFEVLQQLLIGGMGGPHTPVKIKEWGWLDTGCGGDSSGHTSMGEGRFYSASGKSQFL